MYHYDGQRWDVVPITQNEGGPILRPGLSDIFGFGPTDVYAVGERAYENPNPPPAILDSSLIIHFDGGQWREIRTFGRLLQTIGGNNFGFGYTAGWGNVGFILSGATAIPDTIPITAPQGAFYLGLNSVGVTPSGEVYANASWFQAFESKKYFLHRSSTGQWTIVDSVLIQPGSVENRWGYGKMWYSPWGTLYSTGAGVFMWGGGLWSRVLVSDSAMTGIDGLSSNSIFVGWGRVILRGRLLLSRQTTSIHIIRPRPILHSWHGTSREWMRCGAASGGRTIQRHLERNSSTASRSSRWRHTPPQQTRGTSHTSRTTT